MSGKYWVPMLPCTVSFKAYFGRFWRSCVWPDEIYHRKSKHVATPFLTNSLCLLNRHVHSFLKSESQRGSTKRFSLGVQLCMVVTSKTDMYLGGPSSKFVLTPGILSQSFVVFVRPSRRIFGQSTGPQPHPDAVQCGTNQSVACRSHSAYCDSHFMQSVPCADRITGGLQIFTESTEWLKSNWTISKNLLIIKYRINMYKRTILSEWPCIYNGYDEKVQSACPYNPYTIARVN